MSTPGPKVFVSTAKSTQLSLVMTQRQLKVKVLALALGKKTLPQHLYRTP